MSKQAPKVDYKELIDMLEARKIELLAELHDKIKAIDKIIRGYKVLKGEG